MLDGSVMKMWLNAERSGNVPIADKFIVNGQEIELADSYAREQLNNINGGDVFIDDNVTSVDKVWSSQKVSQQLQSIVARLTVLEDRTVTPDPPVLATYNVVNNLTNCTISNTVSTVEENSSYSATILADEGYELANVTVMMGDTNVDVLDGVISIESVTGDIVITASATKIVITYELADENDFTIESAAGQKFIANYIGTKEYVEVPSTMSIAGNNVATRYKSAFANNTTVKGVKFQDGVDFYQASMQNCSNLEILEGHSKLEANTLNGCANLKRIKNVKFSDYLVQTFANCTSLVDLSKIELGANITNVTNLCQNCENLQKAPTLGVDFNPSNINGAFTNCNKLSEITIKNTTRDFGSTSSDSSSMFFNLTHSIKINAYKNSVIHQNFKNNMCARLSRSNRKFIPVEGNIKSIALFGDSLTDGYSDNITNYPTQLNEKYDNDIIVYNFGRSGYTMTQIGEVMDSANLHMNDDVVVIWGGTNNPVSPNEHLSQTQELISKLQTQNYIVIGLTKNGLWSKEEDTLFANTFGNKYLNIREYILANWETITGLTATQEDTQQIQNENIPESLRLTTGNTHFNTNGYKVIAQGVYEKIQELGYLT